MVGNAVYCQHTQLSRHIRTGYSPSGSACQRPTPAAAGAQLTALCCMQSQPLLHTQTVRTLYSCSPLHAARARLPRALARRLCRAAPPPAHVLVELRAPLCNLAL